MTTIHDGEVLPIIPLMFFDMKLSRSSISTCASHEKDLMRLTESASLGAEIPSTKRRSASHHVRLHSNRYLVIDFARSIRYTEVDGTRFACSKAVLNSLPIRVLVDAKSWSAENKSKFHQAFIA